MIGILAAGSTASFVPQQASAHITTNVQHMLEHIYTFVDGIEAKTNNLPADPASNTVVNTRSSQTSVNSLQTTANTINTKIDGLSTGGSSGFKTIRVFLVEGEPDVDSVICTSNSDYMIFVSASEAGPIAGSDGNELVRFTDTINFVYEYSFVNQGTFTYSGTAGEKTGVGLTHDLGTTQTVFSHAIVTLQTAPGATASCNFS